MIAKFKLSKKKKNREGFFSQAIFLTLILFFIGILSISILNINKRKKDLAGKVESLKAEINTLEEERQQLESNISETEKETYWEGKIREQGFVKEGENPVVVIPPSEGQSEQVVVESQGLFQQLLEKIKSFFQK